MPLPAHALFGLTFASWTIHCLYYFLVAKFRCLAFLYSPSFSRLLGQLLLGYSVLFTQTVIFAALAESDRCAPEARSICLYPVSVPTDYVQDVPEQIFSPRSSTMPRSCWQCAEHSRLEDRLAG